MNDKIAFSIVDFRENKQLSKNYLSNKKIDSLRFNVNFTNEEIEKYRESYNSLSYDTNGIHIGKDSRGVYCEFNPNKITETAPTEQMGYIKFKSSLQIVETQLKDIGIDCNIEQGKITKYHQCYDIKPIEPYKYFLPTILTLKPKRAFAKSDKKIIENSFYMQNKTQQVTIYNKKAESNLPYNCIRLEHRLNKIPKQDRFLLGNLNDDYFRYLQDNSYRVIKDTVFSYLENKTFEKESNFANLLLSLVLNGYSANEVMKYIFAISMNDDLINCQITENELFKSIKARNSDDTRNKQYTVVQTIKRVFSNFKILDTDTIEPYKKLYDLFKSVKVA